MARKFYLEDDPLGYAVEYAADAPTGYTEITNEAELKPLYVTQYNLRRLDGVDYYNGFRVDLMLKILDETYTHDQVFDLELHIQYVFDEIYRGSWLTAQSANIKLGLAGIYTQIMQDAIADFIEDYIIANY